MAPGAGGVLVHNQSWCEILAKKGDEWKTVPEALNARLTQVNARRRLAGLPELTSAAIHGHHIVMKTGGGDAGRAARTILRRYKIPLHGTKEALEKAKPDRIHNLSLALNGVDGIHSHRYAQSVLDKLQEAVDEGGSKDEIRQRLIDALDEMKNILQSGQSFWND